MILSSSLSAWAIAPSSVGPAPASEKPILWAQARGAFARGDFSQAAIDFQRLLDRHSSSGVDLEARLYLGLSLVRLGRGAEAITPLKHYVETAGHTAEGVRAEIALTRAYLSAKKMSEAILSATETVRKTEGKYHPEVRLEALLVKSWVLMSMAKDWPAAQARDAYHSELSKLESPELLASTLQAEGHRVSMELKLRSCAKLPSASLKFVSESTMKDAMERRGLCLQEGLLIYRDLLNTTDPRWTSDGHQAMLKAFHRYATLCKTPPLPPGKLTAQEASTYQQELGAELSRGCARVGAQGMEILKSFQSKMPLEMVPVAHELSQKIAALPESSLHP